MRVFLRDFLDNNKNSLQAAWDKLDPKDKIALFDKLLKYSLPTLQSITVSNVVEESLDYSKLSTEELDTLLKLTDKAKKDD